MLSNVSRWLTYSLALLYAALGLALFILPEQLSAVFAWNVSPFIAMTIGGWCLGNAWIALVAARRWRWAQVYPLLIYLWLFGALELLILILFREKLRLDHPIAWLYLVTLIVNAVAAVVGTVDWLRLRPSTDPAILPRVPLQLAQTIIFVLFVSFLGIYALVAQIGWPGTHGGIFPEEMSLFTLRSFGAFYFSLAMSAVPLLWARGRMAFLNFMFGESMLILTITAAALRYINVFDFRARPGGLIYIGVYIIVGIVAAINLLTQGTGDWSEANRKN